MIIYSISDVELNPNSISKMFRTNVNSIRQIIKSLNPAIDIKAAFRVCYQIENDGEIVTVESIRFASRVLARNVAKVGKVFPFVLTIGKEIDAKIDGTNDLLEKYLLDQICNLVLKKSLKQFENYLTKKYALKKISFMSPGSLNDWPIREQEKLFKLLQGIESVISVRLTESFLMIPRKSISGIFFPSEVTFYSCQLCPRENCKSRKASFDESKAQEYGIKSSGN